ncbi:MAG: glucoamylase family protein [Candidatus Bathyarchaeia archaeon]
MPQFRNQVNAECQTYSYQTVFHNPYAEYLVDVVHDTWKCITYFMANQTGLPLDRSDPDNPQTSLTNIGLYMACVVGACDLGFINRTEAIQRLNLTLSSLSRLEVWHGFPTEWLNAFTLERMWTNFLSTVSLGWYAAGLITARAAFPEIKDKCDQSLALMNWSKLYNPEKGLLYGGFDLSTNSYSDWCYSELSSENRMASFIAIGTEQVPAFHWSNLSREMETWQGIKFLCWKDFGLFVYFMPGIFIDERASFIGRSAANITRAQMLFAQEKNYSAWGFSHCDFPCEKAYNLSYNVVPPYASINTIHYYPIEVIRNMKELERLNARPESYGFRDSINIETQLVDDSYLVLDQGMLFLSLTNYLNGTIWRYFNSDPIVQRAKQLISDYQISNETWQAYKTVFENATIALMFAEYKGINVNDSLNDLMEAKMKFNAGQYSTAKAMAETILSTEVVKASSLLWEASLTVHRMAEEGYNVTLAQTLLTEAEKALKAGQFSDSIMLTEQAIVAANNAEIPEFTATGMVIATICVIGIVYYLRKNKSGIWTAK